jgi:hypothetical protein
VYFLLNLVDELDLSQILIPAAAKDSGGEKGFDPRMLTLLLYAYCVGIASSRKIERGRSILAYSPTALLEMLTMNSPSPVVAWKESGDIGELRITRLSPLGT